MRLRIVSDGTPTGTRVMNGRGEVLKDVASVTWTISAGKLARVTLELEDVQVDVVGYKLPEEPTQAYITCPKCSHEFVMPVKDIGRKADHVGKGTRWECGRCKKKSLAEDWFDTSGMT